MKKVFAVLAAASMFAFVACGGDSSTTEGTDSTAVTTEAPVEPAVEATPVDTTAPAVDTTAVADTTKK